MRKTIKISFAIKNTYRVNSILYSIKQIPLIKKILPGYIYGVRGFKIFANIVSAIWEIFSTFAGKILYMALMVSLPAEKYGLAKDCMFLHILMLLSVIGSFANTLMLEPTVDKYYAMFSLKMDPKEFTIVNYFYKLLNAVVGFLPVTVFFGLDMGVPLWLCLLIPLGIIGMKLFVAGLILTGYEKHGRAYNENNFSKARWTCSAVILASAYGLPAFNIVIPGYISAAFFISGIFLGAFSLKKVLCFDKYRELNKELLATIPVVATTTVTETIKKINEDRISADVTVTSSKKGFEYLHDIFVKRHRKILWTATKKVSFACAAVAVTAVAASIAFPDVNGFVNEMVKTSLPYFVFLMYAINRGSGFTQALFMNCDHSLLTYNFFKRPDLILKLFKIRMREIIKINAVPAAIIGAALTALMYVTGGADSVVDYAVIFFSILCMSVFFSIHYLTIYYLIQPYNAATEVRSGTYRIITSVTYFVCLIFMQLRLPTRIFGVCTIFFCILYSVIASVLVYRFAPKTFKLRT